MYGNMAAIIMVMLWLYACMNLLLYGAETNAYFEKQFRQAQESVREIMTREKEKNGQPESDSFTDHGANSNMHGANSSK